MPCMFGYDSERLLKECMPCHYIRNEFLVSGTRLVTRSPPSIDELELSPSDQVFDVGPGRLILHVPPPFEVVYLGPWELAVRLLSEFLDDAGDYEADLRVEVLLGRLEPADVVVRVRNEVDVEQLRLRQLRQHVLHLFLIHGLVHIRRRWQSCYVRRLLWWCRLWWWLGLHCLVDWCWRRYRNCWLGLNCWSCVSCYRWLGFRLFWDFGRGHCCLCLVCLWCYNCWSILCQWSPCVLYCVLQEPFSGFDLESADSHD